MNELVLRYFYNLTAASAGLQFFVEVVNNYLVWLVIAIVVISFARVMRERPAAARELGFVAVATLGAWFVSQLVKWLWPVARPFIALPDITPFLSPSSAGSFPSGHATFFFALALSVHVVNPKLGRWLTLAAAVVSVTRVMAGIHWPLDILGGLVLAIIAVSLTKFAFNLSQSELGPRSSI